MLLNAPFIKAILYRMAESRKSFQIGGIEAEKDWIIGYLDHQGIFQVHHMRPPSAGGAVQLAPDMPAGPDRQERSSAADCHAR